MCLDLFNYHTIKASGSNENSHHIPEAKELPPRDLFPEFSYIINSVF